MSEDHSALVIEVPTRFAQRFYQSQESTTLGMIGFVDVQIHIHFQSMGMTKESIQGSDSLLVLVLRTNGWNIGSQNNLLVLGCPVCMFGGMGFL